MIDKKVIVQTAKLARITLSDEDISVYWDQVARILEYIEKLKELDVTGVEPFVHPGKSENVLRSDSITQSLKPEESLKNAPERTGDYFTTPKIIT